MHRRMPAFAAILSALSFVSLSCIASEPSPHWIGCASCHGEAGQGSEARAAPAIAGQLPAYLLRQMEAFRSGWRGSHAADHGGRQMNLMALALADPVAQATLVNWIAALPPPPPPPRAAAGDPARGASYYAPCAACHGPRGQGDAALGAPRLDTLQDWYFMAQMRKFRDGMRGDDRRDVTGRQMAAIAVSTPEARWADIAAWLREQPLD
ncbi:MAG: c-type cytochrome [Gammaproteobacteria bacterium]